MSRPRPIVLIAASIFGVASIVVVGGLIFLLGSAWFGLPVGAQGPDQPIAYPHTVHAGAIEDGGLGLDCTFCHRNVAKGAAATIPSVQQCMFCHATVTGAGSDSPTAVEEIGKFRGLVKDEEGNFLRDEGGNLIPLDNPIVPLEPINWTRVHRLPDHVEFVHDAHVRFFMEQEGLTLQQVCSTCHGDVANMVKVKQVRSLKMGDCVDCHRQYEAPTDCAICHS